MAETDKHRNKRTMSRELGLELVNGGKSLHVFNPRTQTFLPTPAEEAAARRAAEQRAERLAAKLRELGLDPNQI